MTHHNFSLPRQNHIIPPSYLIDLFGRLRTSDPVIQLQISQSDPVNNLLVTEGEVSGAGTSSSFSATTASTTLSVGETDGLRRYRTKVAGMYQSGKSLLYLFTFNLITTGDLAFVLRSSVSGSVVETVVAQENWNYDKFDGTGLSGIDIDQTKCHIGFLGFEWLGVGDVVCGFIHNRTPSIAHVFEHTNQLDNVYMKSANLFPTWEIENNSGTVTKRLGYFDNNDGVFLQQLNGGNSLKSICCSLINEGAIDKTGVTYSVSRNISDTYNTGTINSPRTLILFRLNPNHINSRVLVTGVEITVTTECNYYLSIVRNPTFSSAVTPSWSSLSNRSIDYDADPDSTGATVTNVAENNIWISTGSSGKNVGSVANFSLNSIDYLGSNFDNSPDIWALVINCDAANVIVNTAVIKFVEEV